MARFVPLEGSQRTLLPDSTLIGPVNPAQIATLIVRVRSVGSREELEQRVQENAKKPVEE
jgi:hypothetical protein